MILYQRCSAPSLRFDRLMGRICGNYDEKKVFVVTLGSGTSLLDLLFTHTPSTTLMIADLAVQMMLYIWR